MKRSKRATSDDRVDDARKRPRVVATPASADAAAPPPPPPPPTLREWLRRGRFSLALSQGFCAYSARCSLRPGRPPRAPRVPRVPFHARLHAVGGSSSGGLVAAAVASGQ